jgi:hypothetical protein
LLCVFALLFRSAFLGFYFLFLWVAFCILAHTWKKRRVCKESWCLQCASLPSLYSYITL